MQRPAYYIHVERELVRDGANAPKHSAHGVKGIISRSTLRSDEAPTCVYRRLRATVKGWNGVNNYLGHTEEARKESDISGRDRDR